jgi:transposase-like protein
MGRRHFKPEQIIHMLREAEIKLAGGKTTGEVCRELGISEQSYYRWRKEAGVRNTAACRYPRPENSRTWNARTPA